MCDQCFIVLVQQKSKTGDLLVVLITLYCKSSFTFSVLKNGLCVLINTSDHQMKDPQQELQSLETKQALLNPGGTRRYLQPSKRWLVHFSDQDGLLLIMTRYLIKCVLLVPGVSEHTQLLYEWVSAEVKGQ